MPYTASGLFKLGKTFSAKRESLGLTLKEAGEKCGGLSASTIYRLETGKAVEDDTLEKISGFMGLSRYEVRAIAEGKKYENGHKPTEQEENSEFMLELLPRIARLSEAQVDLILDKLTEHPTTRSIPRAVLCARRFLDLIDDLTQG